MSCMTQHLNVLFLTVDCDVFKWLTFWYGIKCDPLCVGSWFRYIVLDGEMYEHIHAMSTGHFYVSLNASLTFPWEKNALDFWFSWCGSYMKAWFFFWFCVSPKCNLYPDSTVNTLMMMIMIYMQITQLASSMHIMASLYRLLHSMCSL